MVLCKMSDEHGSDRLMKIENLEGHKQQLPLGIRKKNIFKTVSLKPCLANQIRKDNLHRSESKKHKQRRLKKLILTNHLNPS